MSTIATICARGGSKGVPSKNIRPLAGKPLIVHTIEQALACPGINGVFISTDSEQIARVAESAGAIIPFMRPPELATDSAPKVPVIQHLVDHLIDHGKHVETVVDLDPTSPLRVVSDIENCLAMLEDDIDLVITGFEAEKNPYFNMVERKPDGSIGVVKPPDSTVSGRQAAPKVFSMNASIYVWRPEALARGLWQNRIRLYEMPRERSIDIDSELDFMLVQMLMEMRGRG